MDNARSHDILQTACTAARAGVDVLLAHYGRAEIRYKDVKHNLVTQADVASEETILRVIRQSFPDHDVLREEGESTGRVDSKHLWIIDPLDGTTNYVHGIPQFSTAIAYASQGEVQVGVVLDAMRDEQFTAIRGQGAQCNGQPISVSERADLTEAVVAMGFYYDRGELMEQTLGTIARLFHRNIRGIRRFGGAALDQCWVACGRLDGYFEYQLAPWDYAAASLIAQEAGGRCADRTGQQLNIDSGSLIVANDRIFDQLREVVAWQKRD